MATKISNAHMYKIIDNSKNYYIFDTYIALVHISSEYKNKFLIQTYTSSKANLANHVKKYVNRSYKTIINNIKELIKLDILGYSEEFSAWQLIGMEDMVKSKSNPDEEDDINNYQGYTKIRAFFLTHDFHKMKASEKRCLIFMAHLQDSKGNKYYQDFTANLDKEESKWKRVLKTTSKYYARYIIKEMLKNEGFIDTSEVLRTQSFAPKNITNFKFAFKCDKVKKSNNETENEQYDLVAKYNKKELLLLKERCEFAGITLSKTEQMHIIRTVANINEWFLKERVIQKIVNKFTSIKIYKNENGIKSLPAYLIALVKAIKDEWNTFKEHRKSLKVAEAESGYLDENLDKLDYDIDMYTQNLIANL